MPVAYAYPLIFELWGSTKLETLNLTPVSRVPVHVKEQKFEHILPPESFIFLAEKVPDVGGLLLHIRTFIRRCLTVAIAPHHIPN